MKIVRSLFVSTFLVGLSLGLTACGDDDDDSSGSTAKLESCKQVCQKQSTCPSNGIIISVDDCKSLCGLFAGASSACQDALKAQSDCQLAQADICAGTGCEAQEMAEQNACK